MVFPKNIFYYETQIALFQLKLVVSEFEFLYVFYPVDEIYNFIYLVVDFSYER